MGSKEALVEAWYTKVAKERIEEEMRKGTYVSISIAFILCHDTPAPQPQQPPPQSQPNQATKSFSYVKLLGMGGSSTPEKPTPAPAQPSYAPAPPPPFYSLYTSFGFANVLTRTAPSPTTLYRIGSITKVFTTTLLLQLRDEGRVSVDDPVAVYIPEIRLTKGYAPKDGRGAPEMTLRHLATHCSGLPRLAANPTPKKGRFGSDPYGGFPVASLIQGMSQTYLTGPIGTHYDYSNLAFGVLGVALERATGETYADLVRTRIFNPLQMKTSRNLNKRGDYEEKAMARGYRAGGRGEEEEDWDLGCLAAAGSIVSSAQELAAFMAAHMKAHQLHIPGFAEAMAAKQQAALQRENPNHVPSMNQNGYDYRDDWKQITGAFSTFGSYLSPMKYGKSSTAATANTISATPPQSPVPTPTTSSSSLITPSSSSSSVSSLYTPPEKTLSNWSLYESHIPCRLLDSQKWGSGGVGIGWQIRPSPLKEEEILEGEDCNLIWHNGGIAGFNSWMGFIPSKDVGVIVLASGSNSVDQLGSWLTTSLCSYIHMNNTAAEGESERIQSLPVMVIAKNLVPYFTSTPPSSLANLFHPTFLNAVPLSKLQSLFASMHKDCGECQGIKYVGPNDSDDPRTSEKFLFYFKENRWTGTIKLADLNTQLITYILFN